MDYSKPENFERPDQSFQKEAEMAESRIRSLERSNSQQTVIEDTQKPGDVVDVANQQEQQAIEALSQNVNLTPEAWNELDTTERLATAQYVESTMADIQGRPPVPVEVDSSLGEGSFGYYSPDTQSIHISEWHLQSNDVQEVVDTVVHEGRHAYQDYAVRNPGFNPNDAEVAAWKENLQPGNYLTAEEYGQEAYQSQPIETDAWSYGSAVANGLYKI